MASALVEAQLAAQDTIAARSAQQLALAWRMLDPVDLDGSFRRWLAKVLPILLDNRALSTAAAVALIRQQRFTELGDVGVIVAALEPSVEQVVTVARVTSVVAIKDAMTAGLALDLAAERALRRSTNDLTRIILGGGRGTIIDSAVADPRVLGWRRVLRGSSCGFCRMLAGRGAVFRESTVRFRSHGNCDCGAEEVYVDDTVGRRQGAVGEFVRSEVSDERRAARNRSAREFIRANGL